MVLRRLLPLHKARIAFVEAELELHGLYGLQNGRVTASGQGGGGGAGRHARRAGGAGRLRDRCKSLPECRGPPKATVLAGRAVDRVTPAALERPAVGPPPGPIALSDERLRRRARCPEPALECSFGSPIQRAEARSGL